MDSDENYIIAQAKRSSKIDPYMAQAWVITGKTLFPESAAIQYELYKLEKAASNFEEAAKCFTHITLTFQNQNSDLWNEITELTSALRNTEGDLKPDQQFLVKMFKHLSHDVQHKILMLTVNQTENLYEQCKLLLLVLKKFPNAAIKHSPRLLEMIAQGMNEDAVKFQEILVIEALPLIYYKTPDLSSNLVTKIFNISLQHYIKKITEEEALCNTEIWKDIFQVLNLCGKLLKWEILLPYNKSWNKDIYWQKLVQIVAANPTRTTDNKQTLFVTTALFIFSLQEYIMNINIPAEKNYIEFILIDGFRDRSTEVVRSHDQANTPPEITVCPPCDRDTIKAFVTSANCWQLLSSNDLFHNEFRQLLIKLPLSQWISRFLFDLAIYAGNHEEAGKLLNEMPIINNVKHNMRLFTLVMLQGQLNVATFECMVKVLMDLPVVQGQLNEIKIKNCRHLLIMPLTQNSIVQYCTKVIVDNLKQKILEPNCSDLILGNLLVLTQLDYPRESELAEQIFTIIKSRMSFTYLLFQTYIVQIDYIEEFMNLWNTYDGEINFEFIAAQSNLPGSSRRIGTRAVDKGARVDFKHIINQQIARSNENITKLIAQFITQENLHLMTNLFQ